MRVQAYLKFFVILTFLTVSWWEGASVQAAAPARAAAVKPAQRAEVLRYYRAVVALTASIANVQSSENNLLQHPDRYQPERAWLADLREQSGEMHVLALRAKSLNVPAVCRPANQALVRSLTRLDEAFYAVYQGNKIIVEGHGGSANYDRADPFLKKEHRAASISEDYQGMFLERIQALVKRFHLENVQSAGEYVSEWLTPYMG
jgi:hypothetical protein